MPRTNNDLEHVFGTTRYHERRANGRKMASPTLVGRGAVRVVAAVATRQRRFSAEDSRPSSLVPWHSRRATLTDRHEARRGVATRFLFDEPLRGWRHVRVTDRRTKQD